VTVEQLIAGVENDYITNDRKSLDKVTCRARHLAKPFAGRKATEIGRGGIKLFIVRRKEEGASNSEINRELDVLRRGFAYLTGWRRRSEVLPPPWRNVDFDAGTGLAEQRDSPLRSRTTFGVQRCETWCGQGFRRRWQCSWRGTKPGRLEATCPQSAATLLATASPLMPCEAVASSGNS
jgi:hypothetical protein